MRRANRRQFLHLAGLTGGMTVLAACGATATPAATATTAAAAATATTAPAAEAATPTTGAEVEATTNAVAAAQATEAAIPLEGLPDDPALHMTEEELLAKMDEDKAQAASEGKTVIEWLSAFGTILADRTQPHFWLMKEFMEQNPDIFVSYTPSSAYTGAFNEVILMRIASGDPPDVIYHYSSPVAYAMRGACLQLDPYMEADAKLTPDSLVPAALATCQWEGKTWSIPSTASPAQTFYSAAKLQELGISTDEASLPKTYDQFRELSGKMTKWDGDNLLYAGFMPFNTGYSMYGQFASYGGGLWDGKQYTIDRQENIAFMEYLVSWLDDEYKGDIDRVMAAGAWGGLYPSNAMPQGIQGIVLDGFWNFAHCPPEFKYAYAEVPAITEDATHYNSSWPNMMFIPAQAKHPKEAFQFTSYCTIDGAKWWWDQWADTPSWKDFPFDPPSKVHVARVGEAAATEIAKFGHRIMDDIVIQWNSPVDDFATDEINRMMDQVLHKAIDPATAAANAQKAAQAKLEEVLANPA
ncbi:MAG: ABC transporter substrate-binding protein [Anaerolineae bacterium]